MPDIAHLGLLDLVVLVGVVAAVVGALRRGAGLLGAAGSALGTALVAWLVLAALVAWGPAPLGPRRPRHRPDRGGAGTRARLAAGRAPARRPPLTDPIPT